MPPGTRHPDAARAHLRELVALVQAQIDLIEPPRTALDTSFKALVTAMALGPAVEVLPCPTCGELGMFDATRCSGCWSKLVPPQRRSND